MLVCGFSGLNMESLKDFRIELKKLGFICKVGGSQETKGKLCIEAVEKSSNWESLFKKLKKNKYIVPFYYLEKDKEGVIKEYATVKYFTDSIKQPFNANIAVKPLLSIIKKLIWLRISGIVMNTNKKV